MHSFKSVYVYPPCVAKQCSRVTIHHPRFTSMPLSDNQVKLLFIPTYLISLANMNAVHFIIISWLDTSHWVQQLQLIGWAGRSKSQSPIEKRTLFRLIHFLSTSVAHAVGTGTHQKITHPLGFRIARPV